MAAEDDFFRGGCHGSDTSQRINDQKKKIKGKGKESSQRNRKYDQKMARGQGWIQTTNNRSIGPQHLRG